MVRLHAIWLGATLLGLAACESAVPEATEKSKILPSVVTQAVRDADVSAQIEYVGRSEAVQRVDIRARVQSALLGRPFKEGNPVAEGDLLFALDPAEFEANAASAQATVARAQATVDEAASNLARYQELLRRDVSSVAKYEEAKAKDAVARAELAAAKAALQKAELDLSYTKIIAPIAGRIGRARADTGNFIGPETGSLVTIVKLDPIKVIFSIGEREYLNHMKRRDGDSSNLIPHIRLANDTIYPHRGTFDLIDNEVDPATGTIRVRVTFPNPDRLLVPGQFVNVILTSQTPEKQVVVPQAAVQENQTGPFVLVVGADNRVEARPIKTGQRVEAQIVALEGLEPGETIIVEGIQKVRAGGQVTPVPAGAATTAKSNKQ